MNKRKKRLTWLVVILVCFGGWFVQKEYKELRQERLEYKDDWIHNILHKKGIVRDLDRHVAELMAANKGEKRKISSDEAVIFAAYMRNEYSNPNDLWIELHTLADYYNEYVRYLQYISDTSDEELTDVQYSNLEDLRKHLAEMLSFLDNLMTEVNLRNRNEAVDEEKLKQVFQAQHSDIYSHAAMGREDKAFVDYMKHKFPIGEQGRIFRYSTETLHQQDEIVKKAERMMNGIWPSGYQAAITGESETPGTGESVHVNANHNGRTSGYTVIVSKAGGHIISISSQAAYQGPSSFDSEIDAPQGRISKEEAVRYAEGIIEKWGEGRVHLYKSAQRYGNSLFTITFTPVQDEAYLTYRAVDVEVDLESGRLVALYADRFFTDYEKIVTVPKLTPSEAMESLTTKLEPIGEPLLIHDGRNLLYEIPVTGIENVTRAYINAITGEIDHTQYEQ